jgi:hypothetical protein
MHKQHLVIAWIIGMPCSVFLFFILMACLWEYRVWVGVSLLSLIFVVVAVILRGMLTEQDLRVFRFNHKEETPVDQGGEPRFWQPGYQENPYRQTPYTQPSPYAPYQYQPYQTHEQKEH